MPRGDPSVWKQHGASYSQLAGTLTSVERANELAPRRLPPVQPGDVSTMYSMRPAGRPTGTLPRGAGVFPLQTGWSVAMPGNGRGAPRHTPQSASGAAQTSASAAAMPAAGAPSSRTATPRANCSRPASTAPPSPLRSARISAATADARAAAISTPGTTSTSGAPAAAASGPATPSSTCSRAAAAAAGGGGGAAAAAAPGAPKPAAAAPGTTVAAVRNSYTTTLQASAGLSPRTYITETNIHYKPPPAGFRRAKSATLPPSEMPKPTYPNDWSTSKQADFRPDRLLHPPTSAPAGQPTRPAGQRDSGRLLPDDVPPASQFVTLHRSQFVGGRHAEAAAIPASGGRGTMAAGYNIITGAGPYGNNAFEHWDGRDYRRHR